MANPPNYEGEGQAIHVEGSEEPSVIPTIPDVPGPGYIGLSVPIISTDLSPPQFQLPLPMPPGEAGQAYYTGVSEAIHVFGDDDPPFPPIDPIPSCCCDETCDTPGCSPAVSTGDSEVCRDLGAWDVKEDTSHRQVIDPTATTAVGTSVSILMTPNGSAQEVIGTGHRIYGAQSSSFTNFTPLDFTAGTVLLTARLFLSDYGGNVDAQHNVYSQITVGLTDGAVAADNPQLGGDLSVAAAGVGVGPSADTNEVPIDPTVVPALRYIPGAYPDLPPGYNQYYYVQIQLGGGRRKSRVWPVSFTMPDWQQDTAIPSGHSSVDGLYVLGGTERRNLMDFTQPYPWFATGVDFTLSSYTNVADQIEVCGTVLGNPFEFTGEPYIAGEIQVYLNHALVPSTDYIETNPAGGIITFLVEKGPADIIVICRKDEVCDDCEDPLNPGYQLPPFTPGFMPTFRRQIGDPTTNLDSYICTLESAAMVLAWHTRGAVDVWGGELIPWCGKSEADIAGASGSPGTNLGNAREAWLHFGQYLDVRSGEGWVGVYNALLEGRAIILQGDYGVFTDDESCQDDFVDNHAISVYPYQIADRLLVGDPICHTFRGIKISALQAYAEALSPGVLFAVSNPWTPTRSV